MNIALDSGLGLWNSAETTHWMAVALVAGGIYAVCLVFLYVLFRYFDPVRRQMNTLAAEGAAHWSAIEWLADRLEGFSDIFLPKNLHFRNRTIDRLTYAGYRSPHRLLIYFFIRATLMAGLPILVLLVAPLFPKVAVQQMFMFAMLAFTGGMVGPSYYLDRKVASRQRLLRRGLPDAIDLLVVCTEAGLGLNASLIRVALALTDIHPALAEELLLVTSEIRAGVERNQAFGNLSLRTGLEDIKGLVGVLSQGMRFGTSVAQTLRVYAEEFRDKRMQKADEEAAKLATKMIFPLVFCFLPGFFIVAIGPAFVNLANLWHGTGH
jgi:tight adherence protein C